MSDSIKKYHENLVFYEQNSLEEKRVNNNLTIISALDIINRLSLRCKDENLLREVDKLRDFIKSKG